MTNLPGMFMVNADVVRESWEVIPPKYFKEQLLGNSGSYRRLVTAIHSYQFVCPRTENKIRITSLKLKDTSIIRVVSKQYKKNAPIRTLHMSGAKISTYNQSLQLLHLITRLKYAVKLFDYQPVVSSQ